MLAINSTDVRKEWGNYIDTIIREKPIFVKRSRDYFACIDIDTLRTLVKDIKFHAEYEHEESGEVVMFINGYDCVVSGSDIDDAKNKLVQDLIEYAQQYFEDSSWSTDKKRSAQITELLKLTTYTHEEIVSDIVCLHSKN